MAEVEKLWHDIEAVRQSIVGGWGDLASMSLSANERRVIRDQIEVSVRELKALLDRLDAMEADNT